IEKGYFEKAYLYNASSNQFWQRNHPSHAAALGLKLLARLRAAAKERKQRLVVLVIPQAEEAPNSEPAYTSFIQDLAEQEPALCVIDSHQALSKAAPKLGAASLRAPKGHYTAAGNEILAATVHAGLQRCGIELDELSSLSDLAPPGMSTAVD